MTWGEGHLKRDEPVSTGGTWNGLLFENQNTGFPLSLVWTFTFGFPEVERDFGDTQPNACVDWVPLFGADSRAMEGRTATASVFGEPIESSVYFFEHHRFDFASLSVRAQDGTGLLVSAELNGDVDSLGLDDLSVEAWLDFDGIFVQPQTKPASIDAARTLLANFTDPTGLSGDDRSHNFLFRPERATRSLRANTSDFGSV